MMTFPILMDSHKIHVPNHQAAIVYFHVSYSITIFWGIPQFKTKPFEHLLVELSNIVPITSILGRLRYQQMDDDT